MTKKGKRKDFNAERKQKFVFQWEKCVSTNGNYTEK